MGSDFIDDGQYRSERSGTSGVQPRSFEVWATGQRVYVTAARHCARLELERGHRLLRVLIQLD